MIPKPWALPLIVVAILVPIAVALALLGPQGMVVAAILIGLGLLILVARPRPGRMIEVAESDDARHHVLVSVHEPIDDRGLAARIARGVSRRAGERNGGDPELLVVAPALNPRLAHWAADVGDARAAASARLDASLDRLTRAGLEARGSVGDSNPMLALEDALREFPADELVVVADGESGGEIAQELRRRLDRPVEVVTPTEV